MPFTVEASSATSPLACTVTCLHGATSADSTGREGLGLLGEVTRGDCLGRRGNLSDLLRQVRSHLVDVLGQVRPSLRAPESG